MQQGSIPWGGTNLGVGQRLATCLGSRPTQVRILSPRPMRLSSSGRIGRRHRPDTGSNPVSLSNPKRLQSSWGRATGLYPVGSEFEARWRHQSIAGPVVALGLITRRWKQGSTPSPATNLKCQATPTPQYAIRYRGHSQKVVFLSVRLGPGVPIARPIRFPSVWGSGGIVRDTTSRPRRGHVKT